MINGAMTVPVTAWGRVQMLPGCCRVVAVLSVR